ncbi:MAG: alpha/beta fold hydrolase [Planctomycetota bacterium]
MRIIAIHGIGDHPADFHRDWADVLRDEFGSGECEVLGLRWTEDQRRIANRFPVLSQRLTGLAGRLGAGMDDSLRQSTGFQLVQQYVHDVFTYAALHDMRHLVQTEAMRQLRQLSGGDRAGDTVLVAHSLGAALAVHAAQLEKRVVGRIGWRGLVMLAPPLGVRSPLPNVLDPLAVTPDSRVPTNLQGGLDEHLADERITWAEPRSRPLGHKPDEAERLAILRQICSNWLPCGADPLHFVVNRNDMVCSDVRFDVLGRSIDPVSIKQGYSDAEQTLLKNGASWHSVAFGEPKLDAIAANHDALTYLQQPETLAAIRRAFA